MHNVNCKCRSKRSREILCTMLLQYKRRRSKMSCLWWFSFVENPQTGMLRWAHRSHGDSDNDLRRLWMSQRLLWLQGISICSRSIQWSGHTRRAERYVPEPGGRRQVRRDAKGKVVDFSALQRVAGVVLVSLVPGQDASFMLWSCWTRVRCGKMC